MKKSLLVIVTLLFTLLTTTAYAWWWADTRVNVRPNRVTAFVYNRNHRPIVCRGRAVGLLRSGHTLWSHAEGVVLPGRHMRVYVYTNNPYNPFVDGYSNIRCRIR